MWEKIKKKLRELEGYNELIQRLRRDEHVSVTGLSGGSKALVFSAIVENFNVPFLLITPDELTLQEMIDDLNAFGVEGVVALFEEEMIPYDYHEPDTDLVGMQMSALRELMDCRCRVVATTVRAVMKKVINPELLKSLLTKVSVGEEFDLYQLIEKLVEMGYERHNIVEEKGQFAVRGGIVDIFEVTGLEPYRIEFDGDEVVSIREFDIESQKSREEKKELVIHPVRNFSVTPEGIENLREWLGSASRVHGEEAREKALLIAEKFERGLSFFGMENYSPFFTQLVSIFEYIGKEAIVVTISGEQCLRAVKDYGSEIESRYEKLKREGTLYPEPDKLYLCPNEIEEVLSGYPALSFDELGTRGAVRFSTSRAGDYRKNLKALERDIRKEISAGRQVFFFCASDVQRSRIEELLGEMAIDIDFLLGNLSSGFRWDELGVYFLSEDEVFGKYRRALKIKRSRKRTLAYDPSQFQPGDFVVHVDHGIGRYMGLRVLEVDGGKRECLDIRYDGNDHLFIPVNQLRLIEKYISSEGVEPRLDRIGSSSWTRRKEKARKSAELVARDLLEIYARRQLAGGHAFEPDKPWQKEMEASFPYEETPHQIRATEEVKADMESPRPMDRLLCGDVGFGKTEVAIRAAFKAVLSGKQCAFLVPTTVLAMQHYRTITDRLRGYPVNIAMLSRFVSKAQQKEIVKGIADGSVDIVIGTHRLLSKDVRFADLGLLIIDEEHRFGVRQKELLKKLKTNVDVLSMTATPIPRTLSMALSGIRDLSVIDTPPRNRLPIHTEIIPFDDEEIRGAIMREIHRGGQVFFVHNRVQSLHIMEGYLRRLLPDNVKVASAHGQMPERELEKRMIDFLEGRFDVLVCTMIIEAGLDFQNVNTIIINRAEKFGLAQLYQLRGRVGRSDRKAYAYLIVPSPSSLTDEAMRRLQAISEFDYLGAGYHIAVKDLEIRGAGNLLGPQQSGHISAVGLDLYTRMLREEVARLKGEPVEEYKEVRLSLPVTAYLPADYISDSEERMDLYRRLSRAVEVEEVEEIGDELVDRFGQLPEPAKQMLGVVRVRIRASKLGIKRIEVDGERRLKVFFGDDYSPPRSLLERLAGEYAGAISFNVRKGFSFSIDIRRVKSPGERRDIAMVERDMDGGVVEKIEKLLNLLEFYGRKDSLI